MSFGKASNLRTPLATKKIKNSIPSGINTCPPVGLTSGLCKTSGFCMQETDVFEPVVYVMSIRTFLVLPDRWFKNMCPRVLPNTCPRVLPNTCPRVRSTRGHVLDEQEDTCSSNTRTRVRRTRGHVFYNMRTRVEQTRGHVFGC